MSTVSSLGLMLFGLIGLALIVLSLRALLTHQRTPAPGNDLQKELDRLFSDIGRGLRMLSSPARAGGLFYREKQEEVGHLLAELQNRLRLLDDGNRKRFEARAGQVLAEAARAGITLPPLETPLITGLSMR
jgi:hypothetical protein